MMGWKEKELSLSSPIKHVARFYQSFNKAIKTREVWAFMIAGNFLLFPLAGLFYFLSSMRILWFTTPDALWWAFSTVTTVGYGDVTPVTGAGRLSLFPMIGVATCFGATAVLSTFMGI